MDDSLPSQNYNGQLGPSGGGINNVGNRHNEQGNQRTHYSIPGILHFLQHECARFEVERSQWDVDRAELEAKIAFLQGERKGQENLTTDLVRRIKMLEYALKQERAKFHQLKFGTELQQGDMKPPIFNEPGESEETDDSGAAPFITVSNVGWRQGRQLLRQYLQEIGYADTIIDVRSNRVRTLLGLHSNADSVEDQSDFAANESSYKRASENQGCRAPTTCLQEASLDIIEVDEVHSLLTRNLNDQDISGDDSDEGILPLTITK